MAYHDPVFTVPTRAMLRTLLSLSPMLAACTPSPQKAAMPSPSPVSGTAAQGASPSSAERKAPVAPSTGERPPAPTPATAAEKPVGHPQADSPQEAEGRRILSTAFVRIGAGEHLTVELRDGRVLVLRDVAMRPKDYCGVQLAADSPRGKYCGSYGEVAAARPGGAPSATPVEQAPGAPERN